MVSRAEERPSAGVWPIGLADRLPVVPIPLRTGEPDAQLDLQAILHQQYDAVGYGYIIYDGAPEPPLTADQEQWARHFLPAPS
jgi:hypothetical protein